MSGSLERRQGGKRRDEAEVRGGDMEEMELMYLPCAACEPLLGVKPPPPPCPSFLLSVLHHHPPPNSSVLFVHFLSRPSLNKVPHCLCPQPADV